MTEQIKMNNQTTTNNKPQIDTNPFHIIPLPKEQWKGHVLNMHYTTKQYYDAKVSTGKDAFGVEFTLKDLEEPVEHSGDEYDFPDKLYQDFYEKAYAWGVVEDGELVAAIETCPEEWSNRLRVTELWIADAWQKKGIGHALMDVVKEQTNLENRRALMLETQSCNVNAIGFYLHEGFELMGFDKCSYTNHDIEKKEVRVELAFFPRKNWKCTRENTEIRQERPEEYHEVESMARDAFWNKHGLGCDEHLLVHKMRSSEGYLPELSRIAVVDGKVVGCVMYSKAYLDTFSTQEGMNSSGKYDIISFGPLCVAPEYQGTGVGALLMKETIELARKAGYTGIVMFGEPTYYPRLGFRTCDHFGITTADGKNSDAFMGYELVPGALTEHAGRFHEDETFENLPAEELEELDKCFPPKRKMKFPGQWN